MNRRPEQFFESKNIMTPYLLRYGWIKEGKIAYELSYGSGITTSTIYGVTIRPDDEKRSDCFDSKDEAESYIQEEQANS